MSYQVLARKWRPQTFADVVGQQHVLTALANGLSLGRIHHAYLFSGTRGVGKTSIARLLAKALNCETGVTATPCGVCESCQQISQGRFVDLIEIDAASRTKVEDTRELLDNVQYAPARGRYKVYLIDEVHMLSRHSFNALLKTLEEPPEHVKFLLATTDPQKLPVTILSRCLQFHLKALDSGQIRAQLEHILPAEKIAFEPRALQLLARAADGSLRDALSLTDQAIASGGGQITCQAVSSMLGSLDDDQALLLLEALVQGNGDLLLSLVNEAAARGVEWDALLVEMLQLLHRIALAQLTSASTGYETDSAEPRLREMARTLPPADVQLYYQILLIGRKELAWAAERRMGVEMTLLRALAFHPQAETVAQAVNPSASLPVVNMPPQNAVSGAASAATLSATTPLRTTPLATTSSATTPLATGASLAAATTASSAMAPLITAPSATASLTAAFSATDLSTTAAATLPATDASTNSAAATTAAMPSARETPLPASTSKVLQARDQLQRMQQSQQPRSLTPAPGGAGMSEKLASGALRPVRTASPATPVLSAAPLSATATPITTSVNTSTEAGQLTSPPIAQQSATALSSVAQQSTTQHSTTQEATTQDPATQQAVAQQSITQQATTQDPARQQAVAQQNTTQKNIKQQVTTRSAIAQPATIQPATIQQSTVQQPAIAQPATAPPPATQYPYPDALAAQTDAIAASALTQMAESAQASGTVSHEIAGTAPPGDYRWQSTHGSDGNPPAVATPAVLRNALEYEKTPELAAKIASEAIQRDEWAAQVSQLNIPKLVEQMALNCYKLTDQHQPAAQCHLYLRSAFRQLNTPAAQQALSAALAELHGYPVELLITEDDNPAHCTPQEWRNLIYAEKLAQARAAIATDNNIQIVCQLFDAEVDNNSIRPI